MATVAVTLPKARRRPRYQPVAGRASFPEIYFVKHIDNSRVRREVDPVKQRECLTLLGLSILIFAFGLLFAWQHFQCVRHGYQIEELRTRRSDLEEANRQLRLEEASLADPQRIDTLARQELGLLPPEPRQVIHTGKAGLPEPASGPEFARNFPGPGRETPPEP